MTHLTQNTVLNVKNRSHVIRFEVEIREGNSNSIVVVQAGRCTGMPMKLDYPNLHPWVFIGGKIYKVIVDDSGESYIDLTLEALAAFKRD